jgi:hypothetical protein
MSTLSIRLLLLLLLPLLILKYEQKGKAQLFAAYLSRMNTETILAVATLVFTTAIATDYLELPFAAFSSPVAIVVLVIASLGAFRAAPAVGLALFLLTAVLLFKRNAARVFSAKSSYGDVSIPAEQQATAVPFGSQASQPRQYDQFRETDPSNPLLGPIREGFANAGGVPDSPDTPAAYGDEAGAPVEGSYPIDEDRASSTPEARDYVYRPEPDTGSNEFVRFGPDMDEKKKAFAY